MTGRRGLDRRAADPGAFLVTIGEMPRIFTNEPLRRRPRTRVRKVRGSLFFSVFLLGRLSHGDQTTRSFRDNRAPSRQQFAR